MVAHRLNKPAEYLVTRAGRPRAQDVCPPPHWRISEAGREQPD